VRIRNEEGRGRYGEERKGSARRMKHLGDITKLNGAEIPKVDIICGGSPCQDLSVAGKREGLAGERSGLFMEQIRVIKEMREDDRANGRTDVDIRPRYMVWENVQGAFSSPGKKNGEDHRGEDFQAVLTEIVKIAKADAPDVPLPKGRRWQHAGCLMGIGDNGQPFSVAYRLHDAQFWGVPQRRKRISLVADFGGESAPEILFERKSLPRDIETSREEKQGITTDAERSTRETSKCLNSWDVQSKHIQPEEGIAEALYSGECRGGGGESYVLQKTSACGGTNTSGAKVCYRKTSHAKSKEDDQGWQETEVNDTLNIFDNGESRTPTIVVEKEVTKRKYPVDKEKLIECLQNHRTLSIREISEKLNKPKSLVEHWFRKDSCFSIPDADIWPQLKTLLNIDTDEFDESIMTFETKVGKYDMANRIHIGSISPTLTASSENDLHCVSIENHPSDSRVKISKDGKVQTLSSRMGTGGGNVPMVMEEPYNATTSKEIAKSITSAATDANHIPCAYNNTSVVRRLTPLECERLQGYPDGWTDIGEWVDSKGKKRKDSDSPRYKALGNSIALPFWQWMANKMVKYIDGHQPTMASLFDGIGGFPLVFSRAGAKPIWASEIEEFPIAVTKIRFPEEEEEE
jgi:site-specific DNA-cytosine methylase